MNHGPETISRICRCAWLLCSLAGTLLPFPSQADETRPNVVILLSDNLGYGDLGVYGGGIIRAAPTPRIDRLASEGMRFANFNVEPTCTPSRSALLTGRYALRSGTTIATPVPGIPQGLAPWEVTLAELLGAAGYDTAMFGKWHLGASEGRLPTDQGFDRWWGFPNSTGIVNFPRSLDFDRSRMPAFNLLEGTSEEGVRVVDQYSYERRPFIEKSIEERSIQYLHDHADSERPFFLFISWSLVHHPSLPHPDFEGRSGGGRFADVMMEHDYRVGRVLDAIDDAGLRDDTLVIYASDNGPDRAEYPWIGDTGPFRGYLGTVHEGSIRTPLLIRWPGHVESGVVTNEIVAIHDLFPTLAALANADLPSDRFIDGVDQRNLILGKSSSSARESVFFFRNNALLAIKWRQFKIYLRGESPEREEIEYHDLWTPRIYHLTVDPKEQNDIAHAGYLWITGVLNQELLPFVASVRRFGLVPIGGDRPAPGAIEIPFYSQAALERTLDRMQPPSE
jgi:arylsulfatase A-like enzyme